MIYTGLSQSDQPGSDNMKDRLKKAKRRLFSVFSANKNTNTNQAVAPLFRDPELENATKVVKKEGGANPGYTITNSEGTRFTVKQGHTVGNTLSEVFSSMVLSRMAQTEDKKPQKIIADAFLVIKKSEDEKKEALLSIKERCQASVYAASRWSKDVGSFSAAKLLGSAKRKKAAGTRQAGDFNDLRILNQRCNLGLEKIISPTVISADFDLHTENFLLKVDDTHVTKENKAKIKPFLELLEEAMKKNKELTPEDRIHNLVTIIDKLKGLGADVFFHKIDHDNGFYRYPDAERKVDFSTHQTSPLHRVGFVIKTQPTLHITEITGGKTQGFDELFLSVAEFNKLIKRSSSLVQFMQKSPLKGLKLDLKRDKSVTREDGDL